MQRINAAYMVLQNREKRRKYDAALGSIKVEAQKA
jgi:DnaJ-class molecular chaperone